MQLWRDRRASRIELGKKSIMEKISHLKMPHLPRVDEWRTVAQVPQQLRQTSPWSLPLGGSQVMCYKKYIIMLIFFSFNGWIFVKSSSPFDISSLLASYLNLPPKRSGSLDNYYMNVWILKSIFLLPYNTKISIIKDYLTNTVEPRGGNL